MRFCIDCGVDITAYRATRKRCHLCVEINSNRRAAAHQRKRRVESPEYRDYQRRYLAAYRQRPDYSERQRAAEVRRRSDPERRARHDSQSLARQRRVGRKYRKHIDALFARDGFLCAECDEPIAHPRDGGRVHVDHIVPQSEGGTSDIANLQLLHARCNLRKGVRHG